MGQIDEIVAVVQDLLGEAVVGIFLHGSATSGGLKPTSDIDILVLTNRRTTPGERRGLIRRLMPMSGPGDPTGRARSVGLEVVVQADVRPWRYQPRLELQYRDWWRSEFEGGNFAPWESHNPDVALLLEVVLQAKRPLQGPPPSEVLDPIPPADLRRAMLDSIPALLSYLDGDERNVVLTFGVRDPVLGELVTGSKPGLTRAHDHDIDGVTHPRESYHRPRGDRRPVGDSLNHRAPGRRH